MAFLKGIMQVLTCISLVCGGIVLATDTARVGGDGGTSTVTMDCGPNAFIVGVTATGGRDNPIGFDLVRKIKFSCRNFDGITPGASAPDTPQAAGSKTISGTSDFQSLTCPSGSVVTSLDLYAATYIDRLQGFNCRSGSGGVSTVNMNVGGDGGTRTGLSCPVTEGLFKVVAKVGDTIDSLKGSCRSFAPPQTMTILDQINSTVSPDPSTSKPLKVPLASSNAIAFTINFPSSTPVVNVGVTARTDLLGGGDLNPPDYRIDLLDPSGKVVVTKSVKGADLVVHSVSSAFNVKGTWKLKITNLKKDAGQLEVIGFSAFL